MKKQMKKITIILFGLLLIVFAINVNGQRIPQMKIDLSGKWLFSRDEAKLGLTEKWYDGKLKTVGDGPSEIALPGTTDEAKAGIPNPQKPTEYRLYRPNLYTGPAWYQREINIPSNWKGKHVTLFLERNHWVTHVWLDGQDFGTHNNVVSPQVYDLGINVSPGKHRLTICVDNTLIYDLGGNANIWDPDTQTNWNGIIGKMELRATDKVYISDVQVYPDVRNKTANVKLTIVNTLKEPAKGSITLSATSYNTDHPQQVVSQSVSFHGSDSLIEVDKRINLGNDVQLWDEFNPVLYRLTAKMKASSGSLDFNDITSTRFGMRKLAIMGTRFTMNGRPLMLRGTVNCAIFPLTGYPPTDVVSWQRIYKIMKLYGLNFIRFHSWAPPEAAFTAADQEGIMIQVEGPVGNVRRGIVGVYPKSDAFIEKELLSTIHTYGNHPSFCLMTLGNEYGGVESVLAHWVDTLIKSDPRHFYSSPSSGQLTANRQWTETVKGRGIHGPNTMHDAEIAVTEQDSLRPVIGHEIGQWTFYPNFLEIKKYTGVLKAKNFELVQNDLRIHGMLDEADQFLRSTGKQAVLLYKEEIENLLRTPGYAGFSLLDLHDYSGQGTALVGLLDAFWDSKGIVTPENFKKFCGPTVPLLRFPKRTYTTSETFSTMAEIAQFGPHDLIGAKPEWTIRDENGKIVSHGSLATLNLPTGKLTELGDISVPLNKVNAPGKFTVTLSLKNMSISNSWNIWVYPPIAPLTVPDNIIVTHKWDEATRQALAEGKRVILFPVLDSKRSLIGSFLPVFWSPIMFHEIPNTMGILCNPKSPLFSLFPTDSYSNWQWWNLIQGSQTMILNGTPAGFRPIVQVIDNFSRNDKLGDVFEAKVGKGRLLVCSLNLRNKELPETIQFLKSLYHYVGSNSFNPTQKLDIPNLNKIL